jgi:hypothetical protein
MRRGEHLSPLIAPAFSAMVTYYLLRSYRILREPNLREGDFRERSGFFRMFPMKIVVFRNNALNITQLIIWYDKCRCRRGFLCGG